MKSFKEEFDQFKTYIEYHKPFSLSRCNDGEMIIMNNEYINLLNKCNGEFIYDPKNMEHHGYRQKLIESAQYNAHNYYVGIACRCCVGDQKHEELKELTGQNELQLTFGNVFVNGNYNRFMNEIIPMFNNYDRIVMVVNDKANINNLPFKGKILKVLRVGKNAWMDKDIENQFKKWVTDEESGTLYLFAAGPLSNILIHQGHKINPNNTYLDIGSTLDPMMGLGGTRGYHNGASTLNKICIW